MARAAPETVTVDDCVQEVDTVCDAARSPVAAVTFTTDATAEARRFDLVMARNSLQGARDWGIPRVPEPPHTRGFPFERRADRA